MIIKLKDAIKVKGFLCDESYGEFLSHGSWTKNTNFGEWDHRLDLPSAENSLHEYAIFFDEDSTTWKFCRRKKQTR